MITLLSWNIALAQLSYSAPAVYIEDMGPYANVFEIMNTIEQYKPDILALQEMPFPEFTQRFVEYQSINPVGSHSGYLTTFFNHNFILHQQQLLKSRSICELSNSMTPENHFFVVNCHLWPFSGNASLRHQQMKEVMDRIDADKPAIILGDMNMREAETDRFLSEFQLVDVFLEVGNPEDRFTWNSRTNRYHNRVAPFVCRFDRIFVRGFKPKQFGLIGNKPISENPNHYISDHFGIICTIEEG